MLNFKDIEKDKIEYYKSFYNYSNALGLEFNFVSAYLWSREYSLKIAVYDDTLIKAYFRDDGSVWGYCLPSGKNVRGAIEALIRHASEQDEDLAFDYMSKDEQAALERLYPGKFEYSRSTDTQDYIYLQKDLAELGGKKYHAKRNHISKFYRAFENTRLRPIDKTNKADALSVMLAWCAENNITPESHGEYAVFCEALESLEQLKMRGAVLYVDDKPVAMTLGSEISEKCFDVNFEKALRGYDGSYAVINNEFAKTLSAYEFINREEDMGLEGLRKAKLSYHPVIVYERFRAELKK